MTGRTRIYYRKSPDRVVVEKDGREIAVYHSADQLVETHIKGLMAIDQRDAARVQALFRKYRSGE